MKILKFYSCFADKLNKFIDLKRFSGTEYQSQINCLKCFDKFLIDEHFNELYFTHEIIQRYLANISNLHPRTIYNHFSVIRQFCRYLSQFDSACYIPEQLRKTVRSDSSRIPYIYTKTEIRNLLNKASKSSPRKPLRCCTYHTLFGLLYTTGIRIGEALALNVEDFHQDSKLLHIRKGKFHKARWVPVSVSTHVILKKYIDIRQQTDKTTPTSSFFINQTHKRLRYNSVTQTFYLLLKQCEFHISKD